ncbi:MAG: heme-degrading domain-containing protein [Kineosporiaceae bacterium]|nr:heme-degrading domain-containing protein [Kineosporiaceae bacterium]
MPLPCTAQDLAELAAQEERLVFPGFDHDTAWALGTHLVQAARAAALPVVVSISSGGQRLFHAALPGTVPDNDSWVERKVRVVLRFGHSSLYVGTQARLAGSTFEERTGLPPADYAAHGGSFPITVRGVGVVGAVTVSGLPQVEDHAFVVDQLTRFLAG